MFGIMRQRRWCLLYRGSGCCGVWSPHCGPVLAHPPPLIRPICIEADECYIMLLGAMHCMFYCPSPLSSQCIALKVGCTPGQTNQCIEMKQRLCQKHPRALFYYVVVAKHYAMLCVALLRWHVVTVAWQTTGNRGETENLVATKLAPLICQTIMSSAWQCVIIQ